MFQNEIISLVTKRSMARTADQHSRQQRAFTRRRIGSSPYGWMATWNKRSSCDSDIKEEDGDHICSSVVQAAGWTLLRAAWREEATV
jgi:hypothetical protein